MKRLNPTTQALEVTDYQVLSENLGISPTTSEPSPTYQHRHSPHGGIVAAFCGLLWLLLLVGSVGYMGAWGAHLLQRSGGDASVTR